MSGENNNPRIVAYSSFFSLNHPVVCLSLTVLLIQDGIVMEVSLLNKEVFNDMSEAHETLRDWMAKPAREIARIANELRTKNPA